jgi:uncharacterized protein YoxC
MKVDWQNWARAIFGIVVVLAGWFILDIRHTAEINSAIDVRLSRAERSIDSIQITVAKISVDNAGVINELQQLDKTIQRLNNDIKDRTTALVGIQGAVDEIHNTVETGIAGYNSNLKEISNIIRELNKQICSQQECNHLERELDKRK